MSLQSKQLRNDMSVLERKLGPVEYRPITSLARYDNNPRKHPEEQLVKLAGSMREFGFTMPVLIDEAGTIIAGEARIEAAKRVGLTEMPVIIAHHLSATQVRAYRLADNRLAELASWDEDALAIEFASIIEFDESPIEVLGWAAAEIDLILEEGSEEADSPGEDPADAQIALPAETVSVLGDLWHLGSHRLLCGSGLEGSAWAKLLCGEAASMAFITPRFDWPLPHETCQSDNSCDNQSGEASADLSRPKSNLPLPNVLSSVLPHMKDGAVLEICASWQNLREVISAIDEHELSTLDLCIWRRDGGKAGSLYASGYELIFITKTGDVSHTNNVRRGKRSGPPTNIWDYPSIKEAAVPELNSEAKCAAIKPAALISKAICDVTNQAEIILVPSIERGTSLLACEKTNRRCFGIEIEPRDVDNAIARWQAVTGEEAILAATGQTFGEVHQERGASRGERGPSCANDDASARL